MKYNVQSAILKSKQAGDTPVSLDGIKMILKIRLNDEAKWLFGKVDALHGAKVTWKQIKKYLTKIITVRDEMRDFFRDNARDRDFDDNHAEIINGIADNAEKILEENEKTQDNMLETLKVIRKQLKHLDRKVESFINPPKEKEEKEEKEEVKDHIKRINVEDDKKKDSNSLKPFGSSVFVPSRLSNNNNDANEIKYVPNKTLSSPETPVIKEEDEDQYEDDGKEEEEEEAPQEEEAQDADDEEAANGGGDDE